MDERISAILEELPRGATNPRTINWVQSLWCGPVTRWSPPEAYVATSVHHGSETGPRREGANSYSPDAQRDYHKPTCAAGRTFGDRAGWEGCQGSRFHGFLILYIHFHFSLHSIPTSNYSMHSILTPDFLLLCAFFPSKFCICKLVWNKIVECWKRVLFRYTTCIVLGLGPCSIAYYEVPIFKAFCIQEEKWKSEWVMQIRKPLLSSVNYRLWK